MCAATTERVMNLGQAIMRGSNLPNVRISCCPSLAHVKCLPCVMSHCNCAISILLHCMAMAHARRAIEERDFPSKTASRQMQANTGRQISAGKYQQANKGKQRPAGFELIAAPQGIAVAAGICINMELKREHWRR